MRSRHSSLPSAIRRRRIGRRSRVSQSGHARVRLIGSVGRRGSAVCRERGFVAKTQRPWSYTRPRNDLIVSVIMNVPQLAFRPSPRPICRQRWHRRRRLCRNKTRAWATKAVSRRASSFRGAPPCGMVTGAPQGGGAGSPTLRSDGKATVRAAAAANLDGLGLRRMTTPDDVKLHHTSQGGV